jgi:hypothetical protein
MSEPALETLLRSGYEFEQEQYPVSFVAPDRRQKTFAGPWRRADKEPPVDCGQPPRDDLRIKVRIVDLAGHRNEIYTDSISRFFSEWLWTKMRGDEDRRTTPHYQWRFFRNYNGSEGVSCRPGRGKDASPPHLAARAILPFPPLSLAAVPIRRKN